MSCSCTAPGKPPGFIKGGSNPQVPISNSYGVLTSEASSLDERTAWSSAAIPARHNTPVGCQEIFEFTPSSSHIPQVGLESLPIGIYPFVAIDSGSVYKGLCIVSDLHVFWHQGHEEIYKRCIFDRAFATAIVAISLTKLGLFFLDSCLQQAQPHPASGLSRRAPSAKRP